jgi:DNA primase
MRALGKPTVLALTATSPPEVIDDIAQQSSQQVVKAAEVVRDVLTTLKLRSWVKTTGGRGLHVGVPLKPKGTVAECLDLWTRSVASAQLELQKTPPLQNIMP